MNLWFCWRKPAVLRYISQLTLSELHLAIFRFKAQNLTSSESPGLPGNPANLTGWLSWYLKGLLSSDILQAKGVSLTSFSGKAKCYRCESFLLYLPPL